MEIITDFLQHFTPVFTRPAQKIFNRLVTGFVQTPYPEALTDLNIERPESESYARVYEFLRRYAWSYERLAQCLTDWFLKHLWSGERLLLAVDDTKVQKPHARKMSGLSWHAEHHQLVKTTGKSSTGEEVETTGVTGERGHNWVVLGALFRSGSTWDCLPLKAGLFVREKDCKDSLFEPKWKIALALRNSLKLSVQPLLVGDNYYSSADMVNALNGKVLSRLKCTAVGYEEPELSPEKKRGRPKKYGAKLKLKAVLEACPKQRQVEVFVYGELKKATLSERIVRLKNHNKPVRVLLVQGLTQEGMMLFTNDLELSPEQMMTYYSARFQIEMNFRELKGSMGAFNYRVRSRQSIHNYLHIAFVAYALQKYISVSGAIKPRTTAWYKPTGDASPLHVQRALSQRFQALRIFEGLQKKQLLQKNIDLDEFMRVVAA
jgi:hypothetical protein